ncbi:8816_t:CDS:10 [Funneliformis caledonium]|uniref:non-specific serine/threonine protein kinase n=2 Tax=Funneliformis TaxID=1117308 RepID=A0A9N9CJ00_9GLOM|nr:8816_t:CDS:10 [Funneliformis caledonium]CAG8611558.1 15807_t:CDS:10 [Funneliformis mosseae]
MASNKIRIGQYNVLQTLGVGSFGKVKMAVHSITGHKVAMKFINRKKIANLDMVGRVKREIQYEVITTPTDIIMVMEYAGGELFNFIVEKGKMSEDDSRRFFQQIICAVEYCHRHKVAHRDLKPENLLLDPYQNVKIADFGLSNIMTDGEFLKTSCGSPNYAAPEVISGRLYAGPEVDVWSCGVILYVMLCGRLPFDDEYIPTLFKKINGGIYTLPSFLSPEAKYLLSSMLVVDPIKRITIHDIRQNPWFNIGLPDYLKPLPESEEDPFAEIDNNIVTELHKKMGFSRNTIYQALQESENNQIKVAYQLVVDHKRMICAGRISGQKSFQSFLSTSPPSWISPQNTKEKERMSEEVGDAPSSITVLNSSLPPNEAYFRAGNGNCDKMPKTPTLRKKSRSKWHFGIRSRSPPLEVMLEIYRALKNLGMEWKTIDPFHVRCKYNYSSGLRASVKIDLQLYRLDTNNYLVDFKNVGYELSTNSHYSHKFETNNKFSTPPISTTTVKMLHQQRTNGKEVTSMYPFFDVCTKLITELAISG